MHTTIIGIGNKMVEKKKNTLPDTRQGITRKCNACGFDIYLTINFYEDSHAPCEVFVTVAKEGSTLGGLLKVISILISYSLRLGAPWDEVKQALLHQNFEPRDDENTSIVHAVAVQVDDIIHKRKALWGEEEQP